MSGNNSGKHETDLVAKYRHISMTDARKDFSEIKDRAQYGDQATIITYHGMPYAVIAPLEVLRVVENIEYLRKLCREDPEIREAAEQAGMDFVLEK